ncbi:MAG: T9SS type A sorting domain-containing protein [Bacteroidota bacterium]
MNPGLSISKMEPVLEYIMPGIPMRVMTLSQCKLNALTTNIRLRLNGKFTKMIGCSNSYLRLILTILAFTGFCLISASGQDQSIWFEDGATWHYGYGEGMGARSSGYERLEVTGDTVVNSIDYRIINRTRVYSTGVVHELENLYLRYDSENDQVYRYNDSTEYLLYDFSAEIGDTIIVKAISGFGAISFCHLLVDSIKIEVFSDSIQRRVQYCTETQNYQFDFAGRIIEGIGSEVFLFPVDELVCDAGCANHFRCYQDSKVVITNPNIGCEELVTSSRLGVSPPSELKVYPNPAQDLLYIESKNPISTVTILDLKGSEISKKSVDCELKTSLEIQSLDSGIYLIQVSFEEGHIETRKLLID